MVDRTKGDCFGWSGDPITTQHLTFFGNVFLRGKACSINDVLNSPQNVKSLHTFVFFFAWDIFIQHFDTNVLTPVRYKTNALLMMFPSKHHSAK